jgi:hypothetical protein
LLRSARNDTADLVIARSAATKQSQPERSAFAKLQALPKDGEPVTSDKWPGPDDAVYVVAAGIARAAGALIDRQRVEVAARPGSAATPIWHVPYRRNVSFTGREELLEELHSSIDAREGWRSPALAASARRNWRWSTRTARMVPSNGLGNGEFPCRVQKPLEASG